jgi:hypothetical protein
MDEFRMGGGNQEQASENEGHEQSGMCEYVVWECVVCHGTGP